MALFVSSSRFIVATVLITNRLYSSVVFFPRQSKRLHVPSSLARGNGLHYCVNEILFADRYEAFLESRAEKNNVGEKLTSEVEFGNLADSSTEVFVRVCVSSNILFRIRGIIHHPGEHRDRRNHGGRVNLARVNETSLRFKHVNAHQEISLSVGDYG